MVDDLAFVGSDVEEIQSVIQLVDRDFRLIFALIDFPAREVEDAQLAALDVTLKMQRVLHWIGIEI